MSVYVVDFETGQVRQLVAGANVYFTIGTGTFTVSASSGGGPGTITDVIAGVGLTGGGSSGAVTLDVGAGDGISVAADSVAVDATVVRTTRQVIAGAGLTGGGDLSADRTLDVVAGDGSIVVSADSIAVGVISDAQHGSRGGGSLHAVATTSAAGFESAADKTALDALSTGGGQPEYDERMWFRAR